MMTVSPNKQPMLQGWKIVPFQKFAAKMSSTSDSQMLQTQTNTHLGHLLTPNGHVRVERQIIALF